MRDCTNSRQQKQDAAAHQHFMKIAFWACKPWHGECRWSSSQLYRVACTLAGTVIARRHSNCMEILTRR